MMCAPVVALMHRYKSFTNKLDYLEAMLSLYNRVRFDTSECDYDPHHAFTVVIVIILLRVFSE